MRPLRPLRPLAVSPNLLRQLRSILNTRPRSQWICTSCRRDSDQNNISVESPTSKLKPKPYYVTTPIFYVNAAPHIGHLYSMVLADILKRWQVLKGREAILSTGVDEHGMKIQRAAAEAGTPPKEFCDNVAETFKDLAERAGIANDHFVRTTDADHRDAVQHFWSMLQHRGYIYEAKHEGWYCVSDETYYPDSLIEKRLDPFTGRTFMASKETGKEVEWSSEKNYHFRLSAFKEPLLEFYKANPEFVVPAARMKDVVNWVTEGLEDLSISRPVERLSWGIRVPGDDTQTIYVWLDALVNYITKAGFPWPPGQQGALGWPADVHVIGKDIVRFHCIYWPAFLLALDIQPPRQILTHAHWTLGHQKMAKSTGNVVNPFFAMDRFGVDAMRFYLARDGGIQDDADYGNNYIAKRYKNVLQGGLGNLLTRITRNKSWNVRDTVQRAEIILLPSLKMPREDVNPEIANAQDFMSIANTLASRVDAKMDELNPGAALKIIMQFVNDTNRYVQDMKPWGLSKMLSLSADLARLDTSSIEARRDMIIFCSTEALRVIGILLQPYMPGKAAELLDTLGVDESRRTLAYAKLGCDFTYGVPTKPVGADNDSTLFPPLAVEYTDKYTNAIRKVDKRSRK